MTKVGRVAVPLVAGSNEEPISEERVVATDLTDEDVEMLMDRTELSEEEARALLLSSVEA